MKLPEIKHTKFFWAMTIILGIFVACIIAIVYVKVSTRAEINGVERFAELCKNEFETVDFDVSYKNGFCVYVPGTKNDTKDFVDKTKRIYSAVRKEKLYIKNFSFIAIQLDDNENEDIWICNSVLTECSDLTNTNWNEIKTYEEFVEKAHVKYNSQYDEEKIEAAEAKQKYNLKKRSIQGYLME